MVATDGHRLAYGGELRRAAGCDRSIPRAASAGRPWPRLQKLAQRMRLRMRIVQFSGDDNHLFFKLGDRLLISRKLTGNFPDYERVLPKDHATLGRRCSATNFARRIERVAQFSDERSRAIRVQVGDGEVKVHSSVSETGESEESIPAEYDGAAGGDRIQRAVPAGFPARRRDTTRSASSSRTRRAPASCARPARRRDTVPLRHHADANLSAGVQRFKAGMSEYGNGNNRIRARSLRFHQHQGAGRPGGRAPAARYVHRLDRRGRVCITWSTKWSTTPSTRRWPATATEVNVTIHDRQFGHGGRQRPRHSRGHARRRRRVGGAGGDDQAARRRQVRFELATKFPAACTASA